MTSPRIACSSRSESAIGTPFVMQAKQNKDWATSDRIRNELSALGFVVKDTKDGAEWSL